MDITIRENPFSFKSEYEIMTPGCIYFAQKKWFSFGDKRNQRVQGIVSWPK